MAMTTGKNIGFRRNIYLGWMDAVAAFCGETGEIGEIRRRLDPIVAEQVKSTDNRREAIDILVNVWVKSAALHPVLHADAVRLFAQAQEVTDRVWLHYGMTLLAYDFFRLGVRTIGQLSRYQETITPADVKRRLAAEMGQLGALEKAAERIVFTLRNWGILVESSRRYAYRPQRQHFGASTLELEAWLLAVALRAGPADELPFADLVRLPELFPFRFGVGVDDLRRMERFEVHRQGLGWDVVGWKLHSGTTGQSA